MKRFASTLIDWYKEYKRDLPWRETADPYLVWISEIILQQTRVVQGFEYFVRFTRRFPDLHALATAPEEEVLKLWQGLGYYSRARNLHAAAQSMNGEFPATYEGVRALRGVGDYTAAAICSISYGMPYAVVDGNVYRVLSRYFGIDTPIDTTTGKKQFAALARGELNERNPGLYNQAIMDFGALQCVPVSPRCTECPLNESCAALLEGRVGELPVKQRRTKVTDVYFHYLYVRQGDYTYINKRSGKGIWQNLYEIPLIEKATETAPGEFLAGAELRSLFVCEEDFLNATFRIVATDVKHQLSHRTIHANIYEVLLPETVSAFPGFLRVKADALDSYPMPRLMALLLEKF